MLHILAKGSNNCCGSLVLHLLYLFCSFPFPPWCHSSSGLLSCRASEKSSVMATGEAAGWSRWCSDRSQMLIAPLLVKTPSTCGDTDSWAAEGLRRRRRDVGPEGERRVWVLRWPNLPTLLGHAQPDQLWKRLCLLTTSAMLDLQYIPLYPYSSCLAPLLDYRW